MVPLLSLTLGFLAPTRSLLHLQPLPLICILLLLPLSHGECQHCSTPRTSNGLQQLIACSGNHGPIWPCFEGSKILYVSHQAASPQAHSTISRQWTIYILSISSSTSVPFPINVSPTTQGRSHSFRLQHPEINPPPYLQTQQQHRTPSWIRCHQQCCFQTPLLPLVLCY